VISLLLFLTFPFTLIGWFVIFKVLILSKKKPMDESNRINHLRLVWWAITRPELFIKQAPWLTKDEMENIYDAN
jgi:hypothetical protein